MKQGPGRQDSGFDRLAARELSRRQSRQAVEPCPQAEQIAAWLDRSLPEEEAAAVHKHVAACGRCEAIAAAIVQSEPEVVPARPRLASRPWVWHLRWLAPAATAMVIVAVALTATLDRPEKSAPDRGVATKSAQPAEAADTRAEAKEPATEPLATVPPALPAPVRSREAEGTMARHEAPAAAPTLVAPAAKAAPEERRITRALEDQERAQPGVAGKAEAKQDAGRANEKIRTVSGAEAGGVAGAVVADTVTPAPASLTPSDPGAGEAMKAPATTGLRTVRQMSAAAPAPPSAPIGAAAPGGRVRWLYARPGVILRTENAGSSWSEQALPGVARLSAVSAASPLVCWGVGRGVVVRTTDGGTWQMVPSPAPTDLVAVTARSETAATVRTADGIAYETSDGGATWHRR